MLGLEPCDVRTDPYTLYTPLQQAPCDYTGHMPDMITRTEVADLIDHFASHLNELSSRLRDPDEPTPAGPSEPMVGRWQLVEQREGVEYRWMDGAVDHYETFDIYARPDASRRFAI